MTPIGWILMLCTWGLILGVMGWCLVRLLRAGKLADDASQPPEGSQSP